MARGGFIINVDGRQIHCTEYHADFEEYRLTVYKERFEVQDWSTFSAHAITKKDAKDVLHN